MSSTPQTNSSVQGSIPPIIILPLRIFFGLVFFFAGLDKLTDPTFLDANNANYIGKQMQGFVDYNHSPISFLLTSIAIPNATLFGIAISLTELVVGVLVLLGLFTRIAAVLGLLLSTTLWLTASWGQQPFYTGWDLPYIFGWITLALAGAGPYSLDQRRVDTQTAAQVEADMERRSFLVRGGAVAGAVAALVIGSGAALTTFMSRGSSTSEANTGPGGSLGQATPTNPPSVAQQQPTNTAAVATNTAAPPPTDTLAPAATDTLAPTATDTAVPAAPTDTAAPQSNAAATNTRRPQPAATNTRPPQPAATNTHLPQPAATNTHPPQPTSTNVPAAPNTPPPAPATHTPTSGGGDIGPGSTPAGGPTDTPIVAATQPAGGTPIAKISDVPVGQGVSFVNPNTKAAAWLIHEQDGSFRAFDATCTHAGCAVNYNNSGAFVCPCHGSQYSAADGSVQKAPARRPLAKLQIRVDETGGNIYYISG